MDFYLFPIIFAGSKLPDSIMVVRQILALYVGVRALIGQQKLKAPVIKFQEFFVSVSMGCGNLNHGLNGLKDYTD
jgi:hypothetical protein